MDESVKAAILASLTESLYEAEGNRSGDVETDEGDLIAGVRDYLDSTIVETFDKRAVAEIAYAWLAGAEHESANTDSNRKAYTALRKAGLSL